MVNIGKGFQGKTANSFRINAGFGEIDVLKKIGQENRHLVTLKKTALTFGGF